MNELFDNLLKNGLLDYGSVFESQIIRDFAGIKTPERASFKVFQDITLKELQIAGFIRDRLLQEGKYLKKDGDNYRILLPSENADQVKRMNESADKKYKRAILLQKMTPKEFAEKSSMNSTHSKVFDLSNQSRMLELLT
jgi:hypothetical protein